MRVLITNNTLAARAGSELYVRDVALGLLKKGHTPIAYSSELGEVAQEIRDATVPVIDSLDALSVPPDIIHGHHHLDTMTALLRFPGVPAVSFCHGWFPWEETPPRFPRILRYVAVDHLCRDRLICEQGILEDQVRIILNFVDLERFKPRSPLPNRPQRALIFSNYANEYIQSVRDVCTALGVTLDILGLSSGNATSRPEKILINYDIVFARGRSALEALAVGAAVILLGREGAGPMVTTSEYDRLRTLNFGARALCNPTNAEILQQQILRYDARDAAEVSQIVRASAGRDEALDQMISLYQEVVAENISIGQPDRDEESRAASTYLRWLAARLKAVSGIENRALEAELARDYAATERDHMQTRLAELEPAIIAIENKTREAEFGRDHAAAERERLQIQLVEQEHAMGAIENRIFQAELARDHAATERERLRTQLVEREQTLESLSARVESLSAKVVTSEAQLQRITNSLGWRLLSHYGPIKYRFVWPAYESICKLLNMNGSSLSARRDQKADSDPHYGVATMSCVQARAKEMMFRHGFLGVPVETFAHGGRRQLIALLNEGLSPESKVLEIGCGCLRAAYWLIRFLDPECYYGIEPARQRVEYGLRYLFAPEELKLKRPQFDSNEHFDSSKFNTQFDFFLAGSIWTHASKRQIQASLDCFIRNSTPTSVFLTSYLPARSSDEDYQGDQWVGTSNESDTPGVIRHSLGWIEAQCQERGLKVKELRGEAFDGQNWLRVKRE